ncbi:MAG: adenosine kinase, partial [Rhodospirillales bacterium 12-54-5]
MTKPYHVVAIGNAIVDVLSFADDHFIEAQGMRKGTMQLIDGSRAEELYDGMGQATEVSGGSAANTLAGMADLGAKTAFIGKVSNDELGRIFRHDLNGVGVEFITPTAM